MSIEADSKSYIDITANGQAVTKREFSLDYIDKSHFEFFWSSDGETFNRVDSDAVTVTVSDETTGSNGFNTGGSVSFTGTATWLVSRNDTDGNPHVTLADGVTFRIQRNTTISQETRFNPASSFDPRRHERGYDKLTMIAQELETEIGDNEKRLDGLDGDIERIDMASTGQNTNVTALKTDVDNLKGNAYISAAVEGNQIVFTPTTGTGGVDRISFPARAMFPDIYRKVPVGTAGETAVTRTKAPLDTGQGTDEYGSAVLGWVNTGTLIYTPPTGWHRDRPSFDDGEEETHEIHIRHVSVTLIGEDVFITIGEGRLVNTEGGVTHNELNTTDGSVYENIRDAITALTDDLIDAIFDPAGNSPAKIRSVMNYNTFFTGADAEANLKLVNANGGTGYLKLIAKAWNDAVESEKAAKADAAAARADRKIIYDSKTVLQLKGTPSSLGSPANNDDTVTVMGTTERTITPDFKNVSIVLRDAALGLGTGDLRLALFEKTRGQGNYLKTIDPGDEHRVTNTPHDLVFEVGTVTEDTVITGVVIQFRNLSSQGNIVTIGDIDIVYGDDVTPPSMPQRFEDIPKSATGYGAVIGGYAKDAEDSATAAKTAEDKAERWADADEGSVVEVIENENRYSAKHWAAKAEESATNGGNGGGGGGVTDKQIQQIETNKNNIATNTANIGTNTGNITGNSTNISTNTGKITTLEGKVSTLEGTTVTKAKVDQIASNETEIEAIKGDIVNGRLIPFYFVANLVEHAVGDGTTSKRTSLQLQQLSDDSGPVRAGQVGKIPGTTETGFYVDVEYYHGTVKETVQYTDTDDHEHVEELPGSVWFTRVFKEERDLGESKRQYVCWAEVPFGTTRVDDESLGRSAPLPIRGYYPLAPSEATGGGGSGSGATQAQAQQIETNKNNIAANTANIGTNTADITALEATTVTKTKIDRIATNTANIATNTGKITTLEGKVSTLESSGGGGGNGGGGGVSGTVPQSVTAAVASATTLIGPRQNAGGTNPYNTQSFSSSNPLTVAVNVSAVGTEAEYVTADSNKLVFTKKGTYRIYGELTIEGYDRSCPMFELTGTGVVILGFMGPYHRDSGASNAPTDNDITRWIDVLIPTDGLETSLLVSNRQHYTGRNQGASIRNITVKSVGDVYVLPIGAGGGSGDAEGGGLTDEEKAEIDGYGARIDALESLEDDAEGIDPDAVHFVSRIPRHLERVVSETTTFDDGTIKNADNGVHFLDSAKARALDGDFLRGVSNDLAGYAGEATDFLCLQPKKTGTLTVTVSITFDAVTNNTQVSLVPFFVRSGVTPRQGFDSVQVDVVSGGTSALLTYTANISRGRLNTGGCFAFAILPIALSNIVVESFTVNEKSVIAPTHPSNLVFLEEDTIDLGRPFAPNYMVPSTPYTSSNPYPEGEGRPQNGGNLVGHHRWEELDRKGSVTVEKWVETGSLVEVSEGHSYGNPNLDKGKIGKNIFSNGLVYFAYRDLSTGRTSVSVEMDVKEAVYRDTLRDLNMKAWLESGGGLVEEPKSFTSISRNTDNGFLTISGDFRTFDNDFFSTTRRNTHSYSSLTDCIVPKKPFTLRIKLRQNLPSGYSAQNNRALRIYSVVSAGGSSTVKATAPTISIPTGLEFIEQELSYVISQADVDSGLAFCFGLIFTNNFSGGGALTVFDVADGPVQGSSGTDPNTYDPSTETTNVILDALLDKTDTAPARATLIPVPAEKFTMGKASVIKFRSNAFDDSSGTFLSKLKDGSILEPKVGAFLLFGPYDHGWQGLDIYQGGQAKDNARKIIQNALEISSLREALENISARVGVGEETEVTALPDPTTLEAGDTVQLKNKWFLQTTKTRIPFRHSAFRVDEYDPDSGDDVDANEANRLILDYTSQTVDSKLYVGATIYYPDEANPLQGSSIVNPYSGFNRVAFTRSEDGNSGWLEVVCVRGVYDHMEAFNQVGGGVSITTNGILFVELKGPNGTIEVEIDRYGRFQRDQIEFQLARAHFPSMSGVDGFLGILTLSNGVYSGRVEHRFKTYRANSHPAIGFAKLGWTTDADRNKYWSAFDSTNDLQDKALKAIITKLNAVDTGGTDLDPDDFGL